MSASDDFEELPDDFEVVPAKSKYPGPKNVSDKDVGLDTGFIRSLRVPGIGATLIGEPEPLGEVARKQAITDLSSGVSSIENAAGTAAAGGLLGLGARGALAARAVPTTKIGVNSLSNFAKSGAATRTADVIAKALGKTVEHSLVARGIEFAAPKAVELATKAATGAISGAASLAPVAGVAAGAAAPSALSNAVERLRASNSPSALDFTRRLDEAKNTPLGAVSTGTLGGGQ